GVVRHVNRREGSAPIDARKPSRVAMSEYVHRPAAPTRERADDLQAVSADGPALLHIRVADRGGLLESDPRALPRCDVRDGVAHSRECPREIHRSRASLAQSMDGFIQ